MNTETYHNTSRLLLSQARDKLTRGDARQASEKGWGSAAQMIKAVAEQRGWDHKRHALLWQVARRLTTETGDADIRRLFQIASDLHTNFHENMYDADFIADGLDDVRTLLDKLDPRLEN